ncbi:four helix bundle protein [Pontibacter sp. BT310]|uniref:Four helix bundle protein n=1 Tax=Pontibacter populi TaxID=890055 RepID=A0ABS6XFG6_9BACT|nr:MULTISPECIES: four helix bundle protein [Pontibacter]MBJ6119866.1 four helix bundle protein [Pontibacter sp. BT310]MBR0572295.1 four helix bundle protein [Microvirga sp. STS03]MBW3366719.1 four helix bundle protein [Pontibacter populi]
MHSFKDLKIWQRSMELAKAVYETTATFPGNERYGLTSQINRAAVSIPSNIAEGAGRNSPKEFAHFLSIALGSAFELETQLLLANSFGIITESSLSVLQDQLEQIQKMIYSFKNSIIKKSNI